MKNKIKIIIAFVLGALIFGTIGIYAATQILSKDISYTKKDGTTTSVEEAINELYNNSQNCASGVFTITSDCMTSSGCVLAEGFTPSKFTIHVPSDGRSLYYYYSNINETTFYQYIAGSSRSYLYDYPVSQYIMLDNKFGLKNWGKKDIEIYYMACK